MDLMAYYQRVKSIEQGLIHPFVSIVPKGEEGPVTEVPRRIAAQLIADDKFVMAPSAATVQGKKKG